MADKTLNLTLKVWRQRNIKEKGRFETYRLENINVSCSFLEMLDVLNEQLTKEGRDPVAFDHDCREGICGACGAVVNGQPHGHKAETTLCQLHMREFKTNDVVTIEPFRANAMPVVKDLAVDRSAFDRIIKAGGYVSVKTGNAQDANNLPIAKHDADDSFNAAACIGCAACVAACPNASAMLFVAAKVSQFTFLPQGQPERKQRVINMVATMDKEGFGNCSNEYQCEAECPKGIKVKNIAQMNKEFLRASVTAE